MTIKGFLMKSMHSDKLGPQGQLQRSNDAMVCWLTTTLMPESERIRLVGAVGY